MSDKKIVILELDMRKPTFSKYIKAVENPIGFSGFLSTDIDPERVIERSGIHPKLDVISCGPIPPNPSELLLNDRGGVLIEYLKKHYDYVIIDSPPVGIVSDAFILSKYYSAVIYVLRQNYSRIEQFDLINAIFKEKRFPNMSIAFNYAKDRKSSYYGYGYYYAHKAKPKTRFQKIKALFMKA